MSETYQRLMSCPGAGDPFDRHVLACILAKGASETVRPLNWAVGLSRSDLRRLLDEMFPGAVIDVDGLPEDHGQDTIEEPDLRSLLANSAESGDGVAVWLSAMVARRSQESNHLWQDLGLTGRGDLSNLLNRHFAALAARNTRDMKWKKFFYRELCVMEGISICKSPVCERCSDFDVCFGPET